MGAPSITRGAPCRHVIRALVSALLTTCLGGCASQEALVLISIEVASDVGDYEAVHFSVEGRPDVPGRNVQRRELNETVAFGYYVPPSPSTIQIRGEARAGDRCLGRGVVTARGLHDGATVRAGKLIVKPEPGCMPHPSTVVDGGTDADGAGEPAPIEDPLAIVATRPTDAAVGADRRAAIVITFNQAIDATSLSKDAVRVTAAGQARTGTLSADAEARTVSFLPDQALPMASAVTVTVTTAMRGRAGARLAAEQRFGFATADGTWSTAVELQTHVNDEISQNDRDGTLALAADATGRALVVWERFVAGEQMPVIDDRKSALYISRYAPDSAWSAPERLDPAPPYRATDPHAVLDGTGRAIVIATLSFFPSGLAPPPDRPFSSIRHWSFDGQRWLASDVAVDGHATGTAVHGRMSMSAAGDGLATWTWGAKPGDRRVEARRFTLGAWADPAARLDTPVMLTTPQYRDNHVVALDGKGNAIAVWAQGEASGDHPGALWASRHGVGTGWSPAVRISAMSQPPQAAQLAVDAQGNARVAWVQADPELPRLFSAGYDAGAARWSAPENVGPASFHLPALAMNGSGDTLLAWSTSTGVELLRVVAGASLRAPLGVQSAAASLHVGLDDAGRGTVVWSGPQLLTARYDRSGPLSRPMGFNAGAASGPVRLRVLPDGRAFLVWVEGAKPHRLMAARFE